MQQNLREGVKQPVDALPVRSLPGVAVLTAGNH